MPNFDPTQAKLDSIHKATALLEQLRAIYRQSKIAQTSLLLYQAGTDPLFNATVDEIFIVAERLELNQMFTQVDALENNWTANHLALLEPPE